MAKGARVNSALDNKHLHNVSGIERREMNALFGTARFSQFVMGRLEPGKVAPSPATHRILDLKAKWKKAVEYTHVNTKARTSPTRTQRETRRNPGGPNITRPIRYQGQNEHAGAAIQFEGSAP